MNTEILLDREPVADGGHLVRALLRITGQAPDREERPHLDLAVVLDRSGSMSGPKLARAKEAASLLVRRLGDDDVVSIVAYDDEVRTIAGRAAGARRSELLQKVDAIHTGGTTNLSGGWLRGRELVAEGMGTASPSGTGPERSEGDNRNAGAPDTDRGTDPDPEYEHDPEAGRSAIRRVLLLTDGLANVGITDPGTLRDLAATANAGGISTSTIGFGEGYDERLLRSMAEAGGGSTYYIEAPDQAPAVFEAEIEGLMALAAQNIAVTVKPAAGVDHAVVLHGYPRQPTDDGSLRLELGDLYALEPKTLLMEFLLGDDAPEGTGAGDDDGTAEVDVATLTLEGHVLLQDGGVEKRTITLPIRVHADGAAVVNPEVRREALLLEAAKAREEALEDRARGQYEDGARKLRTIADKLAPHAAADADIADELEDLQDLADRYDEARVTEADAKWMHQRAYSVASSKLAVMESVREARSEERKRRKS